MENKAMQAKGSFLKKGFVYFILVAFFLVSVMPQPVSAQVHPSITPGVELIKYLGLVEDQLLFNVDIKNIGTERYRIIIQDEQGEVFYKQDFKDARYTKTFGINKGEVEGKSLVFVLVKGKAKQEHVFHVSTNMRIVEDVVVAKL